MSSAMKALGWHSRKLSGESGFDDRRRDHRMINVDSAAAVLTKPNALQADAYLSAARVATERELIHRVNSGEAELFHELVRPYERVVFVTVASILGNDADAEEAVQEAMLKAFKNLASFRQESKFSTWLIQIAVNEARMKLRKDRRHLYQSIENGQRTEDGDYIPMDFADWRDVPSDALEKRELRDLLNQALKSLDEKYRTVLIMRDVDQMSIAETAQILGISEQNVKTRTSRARLQIRDLLARVWARAEANS
jgi:RNA polymerase sigma-70 factor (ECF subfamily)